MTNLIKIQIKQSYGRERIYPINDLAILLCSLLERKTFTWDHLRKLNKIGYVIQMEQETNKKLKELLNGTKNPE